MVFKYFTYSNKTQEPFVGRSVWDAPVSEGHNGHGGIGGTA